MEPDVLAWVINTTVDICSHHVCQMCKAEFIAGRPSVILQYYDAMQRYPIHYIVSVLWT